MFASDYSGPLATPFCAHFPSYRRGQWRSERALLSFPLHATKIILFSELCKYFANYFRNILQKNLTKGTVPFVRFHLDSLSW